MSSNNRLSDLGDAGVVHLAQSGRIEACDELVRRFRGAAIMVARQIVRSEQTAEDVAQDALICAMRGLLKLQDPSKFPSWLYAITRHRAQYVAIRDARTVATGEEEMERLREMDSAQSGADTPLETLL